MSIAIGKILQAAREERGLTLDQVAGTTHIRLRYLQAMEAGNFEALPSRLQVKGFLRSYAGFLGLNEKDLLEMLEPRPAAQPGSTPKPATPTLRSVSETQIPDPLSQDPASRFVEVGQKLRAQRELLGLSLEDIERHTHLRIRYLEALETGDLKGLPSPVQGRGMLKNYAEFLGLSPDPLLLTFADGLQAGLAERRPETSTPQPVKEPKKRRSLNRDIFIGAFIVVFLLAFGVWGGLQIAVLSDSEEQVLPTPPSIAEVLLPSATITQQPTPTVTVLAAIDQGAIIRPDQPNPQDNQSIILTPVGPTGPVRVQIVVRERAYMRIVVDGKTEFDGRVLAGTAYAYAGEELIEIITGSGSALQVTYNEQDVGVLGTYGEAVDFVITIDGVQTPTPTVTLTPTATNTSEVTPTPNP
jgi:cytoskeleton protein RodZ